MTVVIEAFENFLTFCPKHLKVYNGCGSLQTLRFCKMNAGNRVGRSNGRLSCCCCCCCRRRRRRCCCCDGVGGGGDDNGSSIHDSTSMLPAKYSGLKKPTCGPSSAAPALCPHVVAPRRRGQRQRRHRVHWHAGLRLVGRAEPQPQRQRVRSTTPSHRLSRFF